MKIHKLFELPEQTKINPDYAYFFGNDVKTSIASDTTFFVKSSFEKEGLWVSGIFESSEEELTVRAEMLEEWEHLFNIDVQVILERVKRWQEEPVFHELTCGNDSAHQLLKAEILDGKLILNCPDCNYRQTHLPELFYHNGFEEMYDAQNEMLKRLWKK